MILPRDGLERENPFVLMREGFGSAPAAPAALDRRLSDYTVLDPIGSGLRGTVYRARAEQGRLVALKLFNRGVRVDLEALRRFSPDAESPVLHPNLVTVEAAGEEGGQAFCAMALLRGDSLEEILHELRGEGTRTPHLSPLGLGPGGKPRTGFIRQAVAFLLGVAEGLDRAHRAGLVHGRLSPRNLIFTPAGHLVVTDFGSEWRSPIRRVGSGVSHDLATLTFRAPEQIDPLPEAPDARVDVYALGAILYQLLTRRPPFDGRNPQEIREAISEGRFEPPTAIEPSIGQEAEAVILQTMALRREDRYPSAGSLARDLRRLLRLEATEAWADILSSSPGVVPVRRADAGTAAVPAAEEAPPAVPAAEPAPEGTSAPAVSAVDEAAPASNGSPAPAPSVTSAVLSDGPAEETPAPIPPVAAPVSPVVAPPEDSSAPANPPAAFTFADLVPPVFAPPARSPVATPPAILDLRPEPANPPPPVEPFPGEPEGAAETVAEPERAITGPSISAAAAAEREASPEAFPLRPPREGVERRLRAAGMALAAVLVLGALGVWTWLTLFLHDAGEKNRVRAEIFSLGLGHLQKAVLALFAEDREAAGSEVIATRRLGITDPLLERIEAELKRPVDPVLVDLAHPRAAVRRQAISELGDEVTRGTRSSGDLFAATGALGDEDPSVREAAILLLARGGSSAPLLEAYPIGRGLPPLTLDAPTFLALVEALSRIADGPAQAAVLAWSFEDFERLDKVVEEGFGAGCEEPEALAPNLRIVRAPAIAGAFSREWVRSRGRLGGAEVLALAGRAIAGEARLAPLVDAIADGLVHLRGREAARALAGLAAKFHVEHGPRLVEALSSLGAVGELLELARAPLPDGLRARAVVAAGRAVVAGGSGRRELEAGLKDLVSGDPSEELRRLAFRTAVELSPALGAALAAAALPDPALREEVLGFLVRRPLPESLPVLLGHLRRGDPELRQRAARAIGATGDRAALPALALLLYEEPAAVRAGALEAMRAISTVHALPLVAGILSPRDPVLRDLAREAGRCPLEPGESPALRLLALREPLGLNGPYDPPAALREARRAFLRSTLSGADGVSTGDWPARAEAVLPADQSRR